MTKDVIKDFEKNLSGWAPNPMASVLVRARQSVFNTEKRHRQCDHRGPVRVTGPQVEECQQSPAAGRGKA